MQPRFHFLIHNQLVPCWETQTAAQHLLATSRQHHPLLPASAPALLWTRAENWFYFSFKG